MNNVCVEITKIVKRELYSQLSPADSLLTTHDSVTNSVFRLGNSFKKCKQVDKKSKRRGEGEGREERRRVAVNAGKSAEFLNEQRILQESVSESTTDRRTNMSNHVIARNNEKELKECPNCSKTNLRVKVKTSKKNKVSSKESDEEKSGCRFGKINDETSPSGAFLELPVEERSRRRLSDSLPFEHCSSRGQSSRVRRRSVSFDPLTVFKTAVVQNDVDTAKELIASGKVSANTVLDGSMPIVLAAKDGSAECLELLIEKGARINVTNKHGLSPLEIAVREGHFECAQCLISAGANTNCIRDGYFDDSIESGDRVPLRNRSRTF